MKTATDYIGSFCMFLVLFVAVASFTSFVGAVAFRACLWAMGIGSAVGDYLFGG